MSTDQRKYNEVADLRAKLAGITDEHDRRVGDIQQLKVKLAISEAGAAALREALGVLAVPDKNDYCLLCGSTCEGHYSTCILVSTDAGRALLDRVAALEDVRDTAEYLVTPGGGDSTREQREESLRAAIAKVPRKEGT